MAEAGMLIAQVLGIGITSFLILYFCFLWNPKEHAFLRYMGSFVFVAMLFLIPASVMEHDNYCDFVTNRTEQTNNVTTYNYEYKCSEKESDTAFTFFRGYIYFSMFFVVYVFLYIIYLFFLKPGNMIDRLLNKVRKR